LSFTMTGGENSTNDFVWWMNNQTFFADWNDPILYVDLLIQFQAHIH